MAQCFDTEFNRYVYCTSQLTTYIAVGVIIPLIILIIIALVYAYYRCRQRQLRREQQQRGTYMTTIVPVYTGDEHIQTAYNYPYPPHYASVSEGYFDKPPPYEPIVHQISETNNNHNNSVEDAPAILPATTTTAASSAEPTESTRVQN